MRAGDEDGLERVGHVAGTTGSNPLSSGGESVSPVPSRATSSEPAPWRRSARGWGRDKGRAGREPVLLGSFSLSGIDAVPPRDNDTRAAVETTARGTSV